MSVLVGFHLGQPQHCILTLPGGGEDEKEDEKEQEKKQLMVKEKKLEESELKHEDKHGEVEGSLLPAVVVCLLAIMTAPWCGAVLGGGELLEAGGHDAVQLLVLPSVSHHLGRETF